MTEIESLREVQEVAANQHVRKVLEFYGDVAKAAIKLECHENTVRFYMKRIGITPENVREWKEQRLRQIAIEFNGHK